MKEMGEVDAVLPIMHGPMSVDAHIWEVLRSVESACLGNFHLSPGVTQDKHRWLAAAFVA